MSVFRALLGIGFSSISVDKYQEQFGKNDHTLVDVRTAAEFKSGHVAGAINIPLAELERRLKKISQKRPVVVICQTGNRSRFGSAILGAAGYEVYNLKGGTSLWQSKGLPTKKGHK